MSSPSTAAMLKGSAAWGYDKHRSVTRSSFICWLLQQYGSFVCCNWPLGHSSLTHDSALDRLKRPIFCVITPCSPSGESQSTFRSNIESLLFASCWFLAWLILRPWRWRRCFPPNHRLTFTGLHGVISHTIELFIATAVRTSNPT
jgi:hypothetical protein